MRVGDVIRLKKLDIWPRPPAPGSNPQYRIDRAKYELVKGKVYVAVLLGVENLDGTDPIDTDALIVRLAAVIQRCPIPNTAVPVCENCGLPYGKDTHRCPEVTK